MRSPAQGRTARGSPALAAARSVSRMERFRAVTAASIVGTGTPRSIALWEVHMPVPSCFGRAANLVDQARGPVFSILLWRRWPR